MKSERKTAFTTYETYISHYYGIITLNLMNVLREVNMSFGLPRRMDSLSVEAEYYITWKIILRP